MTEIKEPFLLRIGEFARVSQVSIVTLRHYDHYGLLKPSALDPKTGYRYYSLDQLSRLNRIVALKDLGFPLEQIARLLEEDLTLEHVQGMFRLKHAQIQHIIAEEQARLARIVVRLRQIEQEGTMPRYDVRLKQISPLLVASLREHIPLSEDIRPLYGKLSAYLDRRHIPYSQPDVLLWHSKYTLHETGIYADVEAALPLQAAAVGDAEVTIKTLPGGLMACLVQMGNSLSLGRAHGAIHQWMKENGYRLIGPPRQLHLQREEHMDSDQFVTEVQFPVEKQFAPGHVDGVE